MEDYVLVLRENLVEPEEAAARLHADLVSENRRLHKELLSAWRANTRLENRLEAATAMLGIVYRWLSSNQKDRITEASLMNKFETKRKQWQ